MLMLALTLILKDKGGKQYCLIPFVFSNLGVETLTLLSIYTNAIANVSSEEEPPPFGVKSRQPFDTLFDLDGLFLA